MNQFIVGDKTLLRYRDLNYKIWHALSEFVDNSLHAYLHLDNDYKPNILEVSINFNDAELTIFDNAGGIKENDFETVLSVGNSKEKTHTGKQLSEFGMGLKTAGIWLADEITIETKHYTSNDAYKIHINIEKLRVEQTSNYITINKCQPSSNFIGYTVVTLSKLNRRITNRNIENLYIPALSSIYNRYIVSNVLKLSWGEPIPPQQLILATNFRDGGDELKWYIDKVIETTKGQKRIKGWIGILKKGEGRKGGFYIYRNGRQIHGFPENMYRPSRFFGETQTTSSFKLQNMVGEFDLDDWPVNHTKDAMNWGFDEDIFLESITETWNRAWSKFEDVKNQRKNDRVANAQDDLILKNAVENVEELILKTQSDPNSDVLFSTKADTLHKFSYETLMENLNSEIWRSENTKLLFSFFAKPINKEISINYLRCLQDNIPHAITKFDRIEGKDILSIFINMQHTYVDFLIENSSPENRQSVWSTFLWITIVNAITDEMMSERDRIEITKGQKELLLGRNFAWFVKNFKELTQI